MKKLGFLGVILVIIYIIVQVILTPNDNEFKEGDVYESIVNRGVIKIGINPESKPFAFKTADGSIVGYDVDLARYITQYILKSPDRVVFVPITPSDRLIKASTGEVDIVISTVTITPQRQEIVSFSIPYDTAGQAVLVKSNSNIKTISDLADQSVGVIFGTTAEKNMKHLVPTANLLGFKSYNEAYAALKANKINAITSDDTILSRYTAEDKSVKLLPKRYSKEPYGIAFKKGACSNKLKDNLDFAIKDLQRKNVLIRLHKKWIG